MNLAKETNFLGDPCDHGHVFDLPASIAIGADVLFMVESARMGVSS